MSMTKAEQYFYDRGRYGEIARRVDTCLRISDKPCNGEGEDGYRECEGGEPARCFRHQNISEIEARYHRRYGK